MTAQLPSDRYNDQKTPTPLAAVPTPAPADAQPSTPAATPTPTPTSTSTSTAPPVPIPLDKRMVYLTITPALAKEYLKRNVRNRHLNDSRVSELAGQHGTPLWYESADPIRFGSDGTLLDGQHRLAAIVRSGQAQNYYVAFGVDPVAQMIMDTGKPRSFSDHLKINGVRNWNTTSSTVRALIAWDRGRRSNLDRQGRLPVGLLWDFYCEHKAEVDLAASRANSLRSKFPLPARYYAVLHVVFSRTVTTHGGDPADVLHFFDTLTSSYGHQAHDPISELRRVLENDRVKARNRTGSLNGVDWQIGVSIRAWNYYRQGATVKRLQFRQGGANPETIPEPI